MRTPESRQGRSVPYPDSEAARKRREQAQERSQLSALTDESLIELTLAGNGDAFEALLSRYSGIVAGYLFGKTPRGVDAEDLAQEIFLAAHQNLDQLRNRHRFGPWLMKIARHCLFDLARERRRPETHWHRIETDESRADVIDGIPASSADPAADAAEAEGRALLQAAIGSLSDTYRVVLYLRLIDNLPPHLISVRLGISSSATRVRLHRGLEKLRAELIRRGIAT